jgi:predicted unusual protein kinase regulating ubiquinone biosynthesis (AarF/ABC1/UbiB family)
MARTGLGTARAVMTGSTEGIEQAVERLGELRGLGTKVGQMAGLVEASLSPEVRARVGPALARLRAQAARSPYEAVARLIEEELGAPPDKLFGRFDPVPFASASLGQVHEAEHADGRRLAVKVQHPGIEEAFSNDLQNVGAIGRMATSFLMPRGQSQAFIASVQSTFLAELDYVREADNLVTFERLVAQDAELEVPSLIPERCSKRVLTTTYLEGETVEVARGYPEETRRRQAAAVRRLVISALTDHGVLYADSHAGNFFFREDGTVGVLDFGSVLRIDEATREAFAALREAADRSDRMAFGFAVSKAMGIDNRKAAEAIAEVQWIAIGGLVRGDAIGAERVREITTLASAMKAKLIREHFSLPHFMPFLMRTTIAANALLAALDAPQSGPVGRLSGETCDLSCRRFPRPV